jgi:uncharacterized protein (DUF1499 family)
VAASARIAGVLGVVLFAVGPLAIQLGLASPFVGFRIFGIGLLAGVVALVLGVVGLVKTRPATGREGRASAATGLLLGLLLVASVLVSAGSALGLPAINDITTDPEDPPAFTNPARPYGGETFAAAQRRAYPDIAPIGLASPPDAAFAAAVAAAEALGFEIVREDPAARMIEATDTTRIFRFVDDVAVRVRPEGSGSRIDVRSRSRDGKGDLGANAARIRAFREKLTAASPD